MKRATEVGKRGASWQSRFTDSFVEKLDPSDKSVGYFRSSATRTESTSTPQLWFRVSFRSDRNDPRNHTNEFRFVCFVSSYLADNLLNNAPTRYRERFRTFKTQSLLALLSPLEKDASPPSSP
jgi:hypothetical protein